MGGGGSDGEGKGVADVGSGKFVDGKKGGRSECFRRSGGWRSGGGSEVYVQGETVRVEKWECGESVYSGVGGYCGDVGGWSGRDVVEVRC